MKLASNVTGSHFFKRPRHKISLLKPRQAAAGRLSQVSIWNRRTNSLTSRRRPGHPNNPFLPSHRRISADATPVTARRRRRQRTSADTKTAADRRPSTHQRPGDGRRIRRQHEYGKHLPLRLPADHRRGRASAATNTGPIGADKQLMLKQ